MWQVDNRTPFGAAGNWVRDRDGAEVWLVAVRCTFLIRPDGTTAAAKTQDPPVFAPEYLGDPAAASLLYDSDFHLTKPTTDVLLHGHAYAPAGRTATQVDVTLRVGGIQKTLRVTGDRVYEDSQRGAFPARPQTFNRMPLTYERTYGGAEPVAPRNSDRRKFEDRNPVGTGFAPAVGKSAPNVEYPGSGVGGPPAGFGPIPPHWQPRLRYAGTYDEAWQRERFPLYPHDLDDRFFLCSPEDQRPAVFLRGGELVELINLTPSGWLAFTLPRLAFGFETVFRTGDRVQHRACLHTVILEPDVPRVILVWRTELASHSRVLKLQRTIVRQKQVVSVNRRGLLVGAGADEDH
jgi:hypothetical protein